MTALSQLYARAEKEPILISLVINVKVICTKQKENYWS